jgi:hypothetical protein
MVIIIAVTSAILKISFRTYIERDKRKELIVRICDNGDSSGGNKEEERRSKKVKK